MYCCPRCNRQVYCSDRKVALNRVWHEFCFSCYKCRKPLNCNSIKELDGEVFCAPCYKSLLDWLKCSSSCNCCSWDEGDDKPCQCYCGEEVCEPCEIYTDQCCNSSCSLYTPQPCNPLCLKSYCQSCCSPNDFYLRSTCPRKRCIPVPICLEEYDQSTCMPRCRSCSPPCGGGSPSPCCNPCCPQRPCSTPSPLPRETMNYYSRNHNKPCEDSCCCPPPPVYCPPPPACCCAKKDPKKGPCVILERSPPKVCCPPKATCPPPCLPQCCPPKDRAQCAPFCPPPRSPICYPPLKCCEPPPPERICYMPSNSPPLPKKCCCGAPNPCNCNLDFRRKLAIKYNTPCCRRCRKRVYAAEKIMASGGAFHSSCFSCYCCRKPLEVTNVCENQGEIYCKNCYCKCFGLQGYGYGTTLQTSI